MPLGFERLNERTTRPNTLINFIKPLPGPTSAAAQDFLERVAAICYPIMKAHHIAVMSLEEYEPNPEFIGRNFNAGEVIQLVLKGRRVGGGWEWLSFESVQMVMMHELAHCKEMNHSGAFWKVRDLYAGELRGLWRRDYTGEGLWGRGRALATGAFMHDGSRAQPEEPKSLCGGTFRSSGRKRKRKGAGKEKEKLSYAERQQRRILRKFGAGGIALGADEDTKVKLEAGKPSKNKPRVAGSARGRELRAAAALARLDQAKTVDVKKEEEDSGSESDSDFDGMPSNQVAATDVDGKAMLDMDGRGLFKVCEGEDGDNDDVRREMAELHDLETRPAPHVPGRRTPAEEQTIKEEDVSTTDSEGQSASSESSNNLGARTQSTMDFSAASVRSPDPLDRNSSKRSGTNLQQINTKKKRKKKTVDQRRAHQAANAKKEGPKKLRPGKRKREAARTAVAEAAAETEVREQENVHCPACSSANDVTALTCMACSNVLNLAQVPSHWRCQSLACRGGCYVNAGDCGRCGVCGASKPAERA